MLISRDIQMYFPLSGDLSDASTRGNLETNAPTSPPFTTGVQGEAYDADGTSSQYLAINSNSGTGLPFSRNGEITFCAWVRHDSSAGYYIATTAGNNTYKGFRLQYNSSNQLRLYWYNGSATVGSITTSSFTITDWHHIAFSWDGTNGGTLTLYLDGEIVGTDSVTWTRNDNNNGLYVANRRALGDYGDISICQLLVVEDVLTVGNIRRIMLGMHPL